MSLNHAILKVLDLTCVKAWCCSCVDNLLLFHHLLLVLDYALVDSRWPSGLWILLLLQVLIVVLLSYSCYLVGILNRHWSLALALIVTNCLGMSHSILCIDFSWLEWKMLPIWLIAFDCWRVVGNLDIITVHVWCLACLEFLPSYAPCLLLPLMLGFPCVVSHHCSLVLVDSSYRFIIHILFHSSIFSFHFSTWVILSITFDTALGWASFWLNKIVSHNLLPFILLLLHLF